MEMLTAYEQGCEIGAGPLHEGRGIRYSDNTNLCKWVLISVLCVDRYPGRRRTMNGRSWIPLDGSTQSLSG